MKTDLGSAVVWSWIAAFFEGEGYCGCNNYCGPYVLKLTIGQNNKEILLKIKKFIKSGSIYKMKNCHILCLGSLAARKFLNKILPYCNHPDKIKQIKIALKQDRKYVKGISN